MPDLSIWMEPGDGDLVAERNGGGVISILRGGVMVRWASMIQDEGVRHSTIVAMAGSAVLLVACAPPHEDGVLIRSPGPAVTTTPVEAEREVIAVDTPMTERPLSPAARPRLSQTVTLGQGTEAQYAPAPVTAPAPPTQAPSVVVNNNVIVQGQPQYGAYGYGGYGAYGGYAGPGRFTDGRGVSSHGGPRQWSASGWEGSRRTAAPGQTPGVGGNWSPAPSYGPATMK